MPIIAPVFNFVIPFELYGAFAPQFGMDHPVLPSEDCAGAVDCVDVAMVGL